MLEFPEWLQGVAPIDLRFLSSDSTKKKKLGKSTLLVYNCIDHNTRL